MKPWKDYTDNELDDFFKEEVLNREVDSTTKNWNRLAASLEAEGLSRPTNSWKKYLILLGVALFFFAGTYFIVSSSVSSDSYDSVENSTNIENSLELNSSRSGNTDITQNQTKGNIDRATNSIDVASIEENSVASNPTSKVGIITDDSTSIQSSIELSEKSNISEITIGTNKNRSTLPVSKTPKKNVLVNPKASNSAQSASELRRNKAQSNTNVVGENLNSSFTNETTSIKEIDNRVTNDSNQLLSESIVNGSEVDNSPFGFSAFTLTKETTKKISIPSSSIYALTAPKALKSLDISYIPTMNSKFDKNLYLNLSYSPDFSAVVKNSFFKMGYNISAQLEFQFSPRWSVLSGVIQSKKHYNAGNDQMSWPSNWGAMPKELEGMEGNCNVLDIPLNVRYNIKGDDKATMFIVGGISSFVLLNEKYDYIYPEGMVMAGMKKNWEGRSGFLFAGMANLSLGYERKLTSNISLQIEPFVKAPLRDFGFTDVRLISTGVFFTGKVKLN